MKKQNIIIFDFNRTLYDPEKRELFPDAIKTLSALERRGYLLFLISTAVASRNKLVKELKIESFFEKIIFSKEKSLKDYKDILVLGKTDLQKSYVVGDRIKQEVTFGNMLSFQSVWLKKGKFANEMPESEMEEPTFTIKELKELLQIAL